jgi:ribA/ribD-fused uncharacterized protein
LKRERRNMVKFRGDLGFLSNFSSDPVGIFRTAEHAFQAAKTWDSQWFSQIFSASTASKAKELGNKCPLRPDWNDVRVGIMYGIQKTKFSNPELKRRLKRVPDEDLIELNERHDNFWGSCTCEKCGNKGKNVLGLLLQIIKRI